MQKIQSHASMTEARLKGIIFCNGCNGNESGIADKRRKKKVIQWDSEACECVILALISISHIVVVI